MSVNQDDHGLAALPRQETDGIGEVGVRSDCGIIGTPRGHNRPGDALHELLREELEGLHLHRGEVEVQDGILRPVVVQLVDGEALEELALATEDAFQRGKHQRLAEAPRPRDKIEGIAVPHDQRIKQVRLIDIAIAILPHDAEVIDTLCNPLSHVALLCRQYSKKEGCRVPENGEPLVPGKVWRDRDHNGSYDARKPQVGARRCDDLIRHVGPMGLPAGGNFSALSKNSA